MLSSRWPNMKLIDWARFLCSRWLFPSLRKNMSQNWSIFPKWIGVSYSQITEFSSFYKQVEHFHTVAGRNPAPPANVKKPCFLVVDKLPTSTGSLEFLPSQVSFKWETVTSKSKNRSLVGTSLRSAFKCKIFFIAWPFLVKYWCFFSRDPGSFEWLKWNNPYLTGYYFVPNIH